MSRPRSAGSFFWGLILIAAGSIFLLKNIGYDIHIWAGIAKYWPALLIVWGLIKLFDYARWKRAGEQGPLFGAGEVVLLIVVILSGSALTAAANVSPDFGNLFEMANIDLWDITGNSYHFAENYEKEARSGATIQIINRYGNVEVIPSDTNRIVVDVDKTVIAMDQKDAEELSKVLVYSIIDDGDGKFRVQSNYNRDNNRVRGRRFKTSLKVKVPKQASVSIDNRNGNVSVSDLTGEQKVTNAFGNTDLSNITGAASVTSKNGDTTVDGVSGETTISNEFASVTARKIGGALKVGHRNGSVEVQDVKGDTRITNAFGSIVARNISGSLNVDARMTSVEVANVEGDTTVENQFQSVQLERVKGAITVTNRNGSVDIKFQEPPRKNIQVTSQFADVSLSLPGSSSFSVDARTRFNNVSTDFSELNHRDDRDRNSLTGQVGTGGPEIRIDNRNGSIRIEK